MSEISEVVEANGLHRVGARLPLGTYLRETWDRRDFIWTMAQYRLQSENERNRLGMGWVLLRPLLNALIYGLIFGVILGSSRPHNFIPYLLTGVFLFDFFTNSMLSGGRSIINNFQLVRSLSFPRLVLPLSVVLQQFLSFLPAIAMMLVLTVVFGSLPTWNWLLLIPLIVLFALFNTGVALVMARLTVHFRDLSQFVPYINRILFYTAGVFFNPATVLQSYPHLRLIFDWYPLNHVLALGRGILVRGYHIDYAYFWRLALWAVGLLVVGVIYFWAAEERYGRDD
ncbi:ABC transporter permease [Nigerium massiliense]|uniref:ABC transporter permease n=1 Tax=Nigerium massiliense TaxID=1522317 RepID=UPI00058B54AA|nr:ABC transporter permease [Nigerium massiliense]